MGQFIKYWKPGSTDATVSASYHDGVYGAVTSAITVSNILYVAQGNDRIVGDTSSWDHALAYVSVTEGFSGNIGTTGSPMTIGANTNSGSTQYGVDGSTASGIEKFDYAASGGSAYVVMGTGGIDLVRVASVGKLWITSGTLNNRLELTTGELDIGVSVNLSSRTLELFGGKSTINYRADATDPTLNVYGGTHYIARTCGATTIYGGTVIVDVHNETNAFTGALTVAGGNLIWKSGSIGAVQANFLGGNVMFGQATQPIDLSATSLIVLGTTQFDTFGQLSSKVTWPASTGIQIKGAPPTGIPRVAAATV